MRFWLYFCCVCVCLLQSVETAAQVMIVSLRGGGSIITNRAEIASGARRLKKIDKAVEGFVFPVKSSKKRHGPGADVILTGVFTQGGEIKKALSEAAAELPEIVGFTDGLLTGGRRSAADNLAWVAPGGMTYHDPSHECATGSEKVWVKEMRDLSGFAPCPECFNHGEKIPNFILREFGGLSIAPGALLLDNAGFLAWAKESLPLRNPGFISTQKLMIFPKMEMTKRGLHQLARETELAYRRRTWKVIEVIAKHSETDTGSISSFDSEVTDDND